MPASSRHRRRSRSSCTRRRTGRPRQAPASADADRRRRRAVPGRRDDAVEVSPGREEAVPPQPGRYGRDHLCEGRSPVVRTVLRQCPVPLRGDLQGQTATGPRGRGARLLDVLLRRRPPEAVLRLAGCRLRARRRLGDRQLRHDPRRDPARPGAGCGLQPRVFPQGDGARAGPRAGNAAHRPGSVAQPGQLADGAQPRRLRRAASPLTPTRSTSPSPRRRSCGSTRSSRVRPGIASASRA